jgi:hypothetical protein
VLRYPDTARREGKADLRGNIERSQDELLSPDTEILAEVLRANLRRTSRRVRRA